MINSLPKNQVKILFYALVIGAVFLVGHVSAVAIYGTGSNSKANSLLGINNEGPLSASDMGLFWEIYDNLRENYIDEELPENRVLVESASKGLVAGLDDKYTNYYTESEWTEIQEGNSGKFEGIGIKLVAGDPYVIIESPIKGSPAQKEGLMAEDRILEVNGESMEDISITKVAEKIRGEKGTKVKLNVYRPDSGETLDFEVTRDNIDIDSIDYEKLSDGGYVITISKFTESSYAEFQQQWVKTASEVAAAKPKYVVLDLRNNTGGWVDAAKFVLGEFVPNGSVILKEVDREGNETITTTDRDGKLTKVPMAVLVNAGTASSSEIVSGALQDLNRAELVGQSTLGKGVEQRIISTSDGGSLHVVFKRWYTPNGHNLSKENALKPDKEVKLSTDDIQAGRDPQLQAARDMLN